MITNYIIIHLAVMLTHVEPWYIMIANSILVFYVLPGVMLAGRLRGGHGEE